MLVYFMRHASAGQASTDFAQDEERDLDEKGIAQCSAAGSALRGKGIRFDAIVASPFVRTQQTAARICDTTFSDCVVLCDDALRPDATPAEFLRMFERYRGHDSVLIVGHDLNLGDFVGALFQMEGARPPVLHFDHAALAIVKFDGQSGQLLRSLDPREA
jgi:phosphohistidine phosphatase